MELKNIAPLILFLIAASVSIYLIVAGRMKHYNNLFASAAASLHLNLRRGTLLSFPEIGGERGGMKVRVLKQARREGNLLECRVRYTLSLAVNFRITREGALEQVRKVFQGEDFLTGDRPFDDALLVETDTPALLRALLNRDARECLLDLAGESDSLSVNPKGITLELDMSTLGGSRGLVWKTERMIMAGRALCSVRDARAGLIKQIFVEDSSDTALYALRSLADTYSGDREVKEVLLRLVRTGPLELRIEAMAYLGKEGEIHLLNLLRSHPSLKDSLKRIVLKHLRTADWKGRGAVLEELLGNTEDAELKKTILRLMAQTGDAALSSALLRRLDLEEGEVRLAVLEALGSCGTLKAVEKIYCTGGSSLNPFLRRAAAEAINRIQVRRARGEKGWLSTVRLEEVEGALSAGEEAGAGFRSLKEKKGKTEKK